MINEFQLQELLKTLNDKMTDKVIVDTMVRGLEESRKGIAAVQEQIQMVQLEQAKKTAELENLNRNMNELLRIVRDGNGKPSLVQRIIELESHKKVVEEHIGEDKSSKTENKRVGWQIKVAMFSGLIGILGGLLQFFLK